jgi:hypothetical protein
MTNPVLPVEPVGRAVGAMSTLSFVGGFVDVVGFIALFGLFTAHVTGNFIMIGLEMVHATELAIAKLLAGRSLSSWSPSPGSSCCTTRTGASPPGGGCCSRKRLFSPAS